MTVFHLMRHGESCSNLYFSYDEHRDRYTDYSTKRDELLGGGGRIVCGDHFFRAVLSPLGVAQCIRQRLQLEQCSSRSPAPSFRALYSSPLERAVQTAILATPPAVLRRNRYTITLLPQIQEAVKYQCDLFSDMEALRRHASRTQALQCEILLAQGRSADAADLAAAVITLDDRHMDWAYDGYSGDAAQDTVSPSWRPTPPGRRVSPTQVLTEMPGMVESRAKSARAFLAGLDVAGDGARVLLFSHGQMMENLLKQWLREPRKGAVVEFTFPPSCPDDPLTNSAAFGRPLATLERSRADARARAAEGAQPVRALDKALWVPARGRALAQTHTHPVRGARGCLAAEVAAVMAPPPDARYFHTTSVPDTQRARQRLASVAVEASSMTDTDMVAFVKTKMSAEDVLCRNVTRITKTMTPQGEM